MSAVKSLKILAKMDFPSQSVRLWEGSGPYIDPDGNVWRCCVLGDGVLDNIESAMNGEAWTLSLTVSGIDKEIADIAWQEVESGDVIGGQVQILTQDCDEKDQPVGAPEVHFTGRMDNVRFDEAAEASRTVASVTLECTNRFTLRTRQSGVVLSDVDQRARSKVLNPSASSDRFAERVPGLSDKTIRWPAWN